MLESSPTINDPKYQRRAPALFGLVALALLQLSIASHQFEHLADHGFGVCELCTTFTELDDALIPEALPAALPVSRQVTSVTTALSLRVAPTSAAYQSRAPPRS